MTNDHQPPRQLPANAAKKQRGRPFAKGQSGNPRGKLPGTRSKGAVLLDQLGAEHVEKIATAVIREAKRGNLRAAELVFARCWPAPRGRPTVLTLPKIATAEDAEKFLSELIDLTARGEVTPDEAGLFAGLVSQFVRVAEAGEMERRLRALENLANERPFQDVPGEQED